VTLVGERPGVKLAISVPAKSEPPWGRATVLGVYHSDHKGLVGLVPDFSTIPPAST